MSKSLKKLIDINRLREFKNKLVGTGSAYVQTAAVDQTIAGTKTFSKPIVGSVTGSSGSCTGNAASATKLQTARTVNGTSFNGTANITTANWGTARNISITDGTNTSTAVSVNGSANVSLNLPSTIKATFVGNVTGNLTGNADTATNATNSNAANQLQAFVNDNFTGGNHYVKAIRSSQGWSTHLWMCYNNGAKMADEVSVNYANSAGSANTATKLATARKINGTDFDGTHDITTAYWGTGRNVYISDSDGTHTGIAVTMDGSGNVTLKLPGVIKADLIGNVTGNAATATRANSAAKADTATYASEAGIANSVRNLLGQKYYDIGSTILCELVHDAAHDKLEYGAIVSGSAISEGYGLDTDGDQSGGNVSAAKIGTWVKCSGWSYNNSGQWISLLRRIA